MSVLLHRAWAVVSNPLSFVSLIMPYGMRGWKPTQCRIPLCGLLRMCRQLDGILPQHAIIMALTSIAAVTVSTDTLPLKISPRDGNTSLQFLKEWMAANKDWLDQKLLEHGRPYKASWETCKCCILVALLAHKITSSCMFNDCICYVGAILLQGFDVNEAIDFQEAVLQFSPDLCDTID